MPRFYEYQDVEVDLDIDADKFLDNCDSSELEELIDTLIERGYIKKDSKVGDKEYDYSISESQFVEAIDKLRNKWNMLTSEEEQIILNIAKRF